MTTNDLLFNDLGFDIDIDRNIIINKAKFIEQINSALDTHDFSELRQQIYVLKDKLSDTKKDNIGLLNIGTNGDTLKIGLRFILTELKQIVESQTLERGHYYLKRLAKGISEKRTNSVSDINLNLWKEYSDIITDSLWIMDKRDNSGVHKSDYWGNFIPQIPNQMIRRYTKKGDWVLDTFAGCGTTLIEAQRLGRNALGIELQPTVVEIANDLIQKEPNKFSTINKVEQGDSANTDYANLLSKYGIKSFQLLIMHPPYFDIIKFSDNPLDLSNSSSIKDFLERMKIVTQKASEYLEKGRYLALVIGDKYHKGEWIPLGFLTMQEILKTGFTLKSVIVKNFEDTTGKRNQKELWRYRALVGGFYIFKHEYIFLFMKN
jgi:16S rRNA G966 N2-methylase RsmD